MSAIDPVATPRLSHELTQLVRRGVLTDAEAAALRSAALRDHATVPCSSPATPARGRVLEVLGYVGGALMLSALIFLGVTVWGDLSPAARIAIALATLAFSAGGGTLMVSLRTRRSLGLVLLALSTAAAGFAYFTLTHDDHLTISSAVVVLTSAVGMIVTRSAAFAVSGWAGAMMVVSTVVITAEQPSEPLSSAVTLAVGFALVALLLLGAGLRTDRTVAWSLAGLSGWSSAAALLFEGTHGDAASLVVATVVAAALLAAFVRVRRSPFAVIGCLVLLSVWPSALYELVGSAIGVAVGLTAAGGVLIASVVALSRTRLRRIGVHDSQPHKAFSARELRRP